MQRMLPALVLAVLIHALLLLTDADWLFRQEFIVPDARVVTMRLVERVPYHPPAIRSLPAPPTSLPTTPKKPMVKKPVVQKQVAKKKPVIPKPKPVVQKSPAKRLSTPPPPQPAPILSATEPDPEFFEPPSTVNTVQSVSDQPSSRSVSNSPSIVKDAPTATETKTAAAATVVMATPRYSENPPPAYPSIARKRGYEGTVIVEVFVSEDGRVGELRIAESSTFKQLDRSAVKAVKRWRFEPGTQAGKTVAMWVRVPVNFRLQ